MSATSDPLIGATVAGRYLVQRKLGQGGMGAVYLAEQSPLGRPVALKVIKRSLTDDTQAVKRFIQEAKTMAALAHPHVVVVHDFGTLDGSDPGEEEGAGLFIAMEFLEGESLHRKLQADRRIDAGEVLRIGIAVCDALTAAHNQGVIHRDLKPDNIMLVSSASPPFVKVLDFGVAKLLDSGPGTRITDTGFVVGTPGYISPEQLEGVHDDPRSDLYALGVILFECLTGKSPFEAPTPARLALKHLAERPPLPSEVAPDAGIVPEVEALVMRLLCKAPAERPPSAQKLREIMAAMRANLVRGTPEPFATQGMTEPKIATPDAPVGTMPMGSAPPLVATAPQTTPASGGGHSEVAALETPPTGPVPVVTQEVKLVVPTPWKGTEAQARWKQGGRLVWPLAGIVIAGIAIVANTVRDMDTGDKPTAHVSVSSEGTPSSTVSSSSDRVEAKAPAAADAPPVVEKPTTPRPPSAPKKGALARTKREPTLRRNTAPTEPPEVPTQTAPPVGVPPAGLPRFPRGGKNLDEEGRLAQMDGYLQALAMVRGTPVAYPAVVNTFVKPLGLDTVVELTQKRIRVIRRQHENGALSDEEFQSELKQLSEVELILEDLKR